jgi:hypothetical protein
MGVKLHRGFESRPLRHSCRFKPWPRKSGPRPFWARFPADWAASRPDTMPGLSASIRRRDAFARVRVLRSIGTKARTPRDDQFDQRARAGDAPGTVLYERLSMSVDREPALRTVEVRHGCSLRLADCDDSGGAPRSPALHLTLTARATHAKSLASKELSAFAQSETCPGRRKIPASRRSGLRG